MKQATTARTPQQTTERPEQQTRRPQDQNSTQNLKAPVSTDSASSPQPRIPEIFQTRAKESARKRPTLAEVPAPFRTRRGQVTGRLIIGLGLRPRSKWTTRGRPKRRLEFVITSSKPKCQCYKTILFVSRRRGPGKLTARISAFCNGLSAPISASP
jgi:hypothetical protein